MSARWCALQASRAVSQPTFEPGVVVAFALTAIALAATDTDPFPEAACTHEWADMLDGSGAYCRGCGVRRFDTTGPEHPGHSVKVRDHV